MPTQEAQFKEAMLNTYHEARRHGYRATYFLRMIGELGAVKAAKQLVSDPRYSSGFTQLCLMKRLDLTVESLILRPEFRELFNDEDRKAAKQKLDKLEISQDFQPPAIS